LLAGYDGFTSTITLIIKYLAELPHIYDAVYRGNWFFFVFLFFGGPSCRRWRVFNQRKWL